MSNIDQLIDMMSPYMEAFQKDPTQTGSYVTIMKLTELIEDAGYPRVFASQCAINVKIVVSDPADADKAAKFLFAGFGMMERIVADTSRRNLLDAAILPILLDACRQLSVEV
jgi:hypothetical protein